MPKAMQWDLLMSPSRVFSNEKDQSPARTPFDRDFDRIAFSTAFRRLGDKTQVFPLPANDHIHSRLTHSLEVSSVGRSLGNLIGTDLKKQAKTLEPFRFGQVVAAGCLAHDIGNPPFGHAGEDAIRVWFDSNPGVLKKLSAAQKRDFLFFEGNAQGLRIMSKTGMYLREGGLQLTAAVIGASCKYPWTQAAKKTERFARKMEKHGINDAEADYFSQVAAKLGLIRKGPHAWCRHPLAFLVEAADDICYRVLDLEDGYLLGKVRYREARKALQDIAPDASPTGLPGEEESEPYKRKGAIKLLRSTAINRLIEYAAQVFRDNAKAILEGTFEKDLVSEMPSSGQFKRLKDLVAEHCYKAHDVVLVELAGYKVMGEFLNGLLNTKGKQAEKFKALLPSGPPTHGRYEELLEITGFLSGMTDSYAVRLFREATGVALPGSNARL